MRCVLWMAVFSTCLLGMTVDSVIIRPYRTAAKAKLQPLGDLDEEPLGGRRQHGGRRRKKTFRPNSSRCCKIGYKVAKRKLSCDVSVLEVVRKVSDLQRAKMKYNRPRKVPTSSKISAKLSKKLGECLKSFPRFFEKCCEYRQKYYKSMHRCKKRSRKDRRKCRQTVRKRYKVTGGKKGRGNVNRKQRRSRGRRGV